MKVSLTERAIAALASAPPAVQRGFIKQIHFLIRNLQHPSLHAKKYTSPKTVGRRASMMTGDSISPSRAIPTSSSTSFLTPNDQQPSLRPSHP